MYPIQSSRFSGPQGKRAAPTTAQIPNTRRGALQRERGGSARWQGADCRSPHPSGAHRLRIVTHGARGWSPGVPIRRARPVSATTRPRCLCRCLCRWGDPRERPVPDERRWPDRVLRSSEPVRHVQPLRVDREAFLTRTATGAAVSEPRRPASCRQPATHRAARRTRSVRLRRSRRRSRSGSRVCPRCCSSPACSPNRT